MIYEVKNNVVHKIYTKEELYAEAEELSQKYFSINFLDAIAKFKKDLFDKERDGNDLEHLFRDTIGGHAYLLGLM